MTSAFADHVEPVGPTSPSILASRELKRIANAWGTAEFGWTCYFRPGSCEIVAWLGRGVDRHGRPRNIVATTEDQDPRVALRRLLGELFQVDGK